MGGLIRLPLRGKDILIYSNCDSPNGRHHGTVWSSFDGGETWPLKRLVYEDAFAYSSLASGRPGTPSEGWIYLHFESGGSKVARFNFSWLLGGEKTGDGTVPTGLTNESARTASSGQPARRKLRSLPAGGGEHPCRLVRFLHTSPKSIPTNRKCAVD